MIIVKETYRSRNDFKAVYKCELWGMSRKAGDTAMVFSMGL